MEQVLSLVASFIGVVTAAYTTYRLIRRDLKPKERKRFGYNRLPMWLGSNSDVVGRSEQFKQLNEAWDDPNINIVSLVAQGGVGKSALITEWLNMASEQSLDYDTLIVWSFNTEDTTEVFVTEALRFFGDENPEEGEARGRGERLARFIRECEKPLLILDGLEPRQDPSGPERGHLHDKSIRALLIELARDLEPAGENPGLCLISTRLAIADLTPFEGDGKPCRTIKLRNLSPEAGAELLRSEGVRGLEEELESASTDFQGHALALILLGTYLREVYEGNVRKRDEIKALLNEQDKAGVYARRVMASYEKWYGEGPERAVLRLLGLFELPEKEDYFREFLQSDPVSGLTDTREDFDEREWRRVIGNLNSANLLSRREDLPKQPEVWKLDTHALIREYFREKLQESKNAWREGNDRLYELYKSKVEGRPTTTKEAKLLLQAMIHGCNAGRFQEALHLIYLPHIMGGEDEAYAENELGVAVGGLISVLSHFFEKDWKEDVQWQKPVQQLNERDKLLVLTDAGRYLTQSRGYAAPEVGKCYKTAETLSDETKDQDPRRFFEARLGLSRFYRVGGKFKASYKAAHELDTLYCQLEKSQPDTTRSTLYPTVFSAVQRALVAYFYYSGDFVNTEKHAKNGAISYDNNKQALIRARLDINEPSILCLSYQAAALWFLGEPNQAVIKSREALRQANDLKHAHTLAIALLLDAMVHHFRRDPSSTKESAARLKQLCEKKGFPLWRISGEILYAWSVTRIKQDKQEAKRFPLWRKLSELGEIQRARSLPNTEQDKHEAFDEDIMDGIRSWEEDYSAKLFRPYWYALLAETYLMKRRPKDGLEQVKNGLKSARETGEHWWDAELYRLQGELMLLHTQDTREAEEGFDKALKSFQKACARARRQKAKSLELRAAMSLARVRKQQDRKEDARSALEKIYSSFDEGFETNDLKDAKQLLDDLL